MVYYMKKSGDAEFVAKIADDQMENYYLGKMALVTELDTVKKADP